MKFTHIVFISCFFVSFSLLAQNTRYKSSRNKEIDVVHTKLKVAFNFDNKTMDGEAWITLKSHFEATNTLLLDAKGMVIHNVFLEDKKLAYDYDEFVLNIALPKYYKKDEAFTVHITYTARPEKVKDKITKQLTNAKGLYFIDASASKPSSSMQVWTHGQTQANSAWFPTIDAPNQKMSQEIYITVPKTYQTLSNGKLISTTTKDNKRTDYWKQDKKHAPYLTFMGIGKFTVVNDFYNDLPISYYVKEEYAPYAKAIFGLTPEMIQFFEDKLAIPFPWGKYSQIVVSDFITGAMENTTAVVHGEQAYQTPGQLIDNNTQENTIAQQIFNHWFGNLVTAESWSNLTLNASFASYGAYLWSEYKYGKIAAEMHYFEKVEAYKISQDQNKSLVRYTYDETDELFDLVTYNKGLAVVHMLRDYLGDEAFFKGLNAYLTTYKFKTAEVHQLRMIFEELTGKDLNWFFNQWYFGVNHPKIEISYDYNTLRKTVTVNIKQLQKEVFKFPFAIDIFEGLKRTRHKVFITGNDASFTFPYTKMPNLIQVNANNVMLCKVYENKILSEYIFQLKNADNFSHRREALFQVATKQDDKAAFNAIVNALDDDSYQIRKLALQQIDLINKFSKKEAIKKIMIMANNDPKTLVQAEAISTLGKLIDPELKPIFEQALTSQSYSVLGKALVSMYYVDKALAIQKSKELPDEVRKILATPLTKIFIEAKDESELPFVAKSVISGMYLANDDATKVLYQKALDQISVTNNTIAIQNLVDDMVLKGNEYKGFNFDKIMINLMRTMVDQQQKGNKTNAQKNIEIIKTAMSKLL